MTINKQRIISLFKKYRPIANKEGIDDNKLIRILLWIKIMLPVIDDIIDELLMILRGKQKHNDLDN